MSNSGQGVILTQCNFQQQFSVNFLKYCCCHALKHDTSAFLDFLPRFLFVSPGDLVELVRTTQSWTSGCQSKKIDKIATSCLMICQTKL